MENEKWKEAGIYYEEGLQYMNGNEQFYRKYLKKFLQDQTFEKLDASIEREDWEEARACLHTLKGISATLGMRDLSEHCRSEEEKLKSGATRVFKELIDNDYLSIVAFLKTLE